MSEQKHIECGVYKGDDGQYCFKYPETEQQKQGINFFMECFRLSEAVNIPWFVGTKYLCRAADNREFETGFLNSMPLEASSVFCPSEQSQPRVCEVIKPLKVRFRAPVEKKTPPRCEDCQIAIPFPKTERKLCGRYAVVTGAEEFMSISGLIDLECARSNSGKCGPDGKCFQPKVADASSGTVAKGEK